MVTTPGELLSGKTAWARRVQSPLREFLRTERGGAAVLLAAAVAALVWVNVDASSYQELWETVLAIDLDGEGVELTLREWLNSGLMTFFFVLVPQPSAAELPRLTAREIPTATPMPQIDDSIGSTKRCRSRKSQRSNSRRASRPLSATWPASRSASSAWP
jgi:hypothetical protein